MRLLLKDADIDRTVASGLWFLRAGLLLMTPVIVPAGWGFGLTGFAFLSLGIYALPMRRWQTEPGLWMLALLVAFIQGTAWGYFECLRLATLFDGPAGGLVQHKVTWEEIGRSIDTSISFVVIGKLVRFLLSVVVANWV